jgi:hypothetical protein
MPTMPRFLKPICRAADRDLGLPYGLSTIYCNPDKGKPVARPGRKAMELARARQAAEACNPARIAMEKLHARAARFAAREASGRLAQRRGAIAVYAAVMMVVIVAAAAFAIDVGMICVARAELQRTADASALAATFELLNQFSQAPNDPATVVPTKGTLVREVANQTAQNNAVFRESPNLDLNPNNDQSGEIVIGEMTRGASGVSLAFADPAEYNSVAVRVKRTEARNGELPLFFGRVLGTNRFTSEAYAQAAFLKDFKGFRIPSGGEGPPPTLLMFPFAVDRNAWEAAVNGVGTDDYSWDSDGERVQSGNGDGIREINLFPTETGAPGNFGTVDIGSDKSTNGDLHRLIVNGLNRQDLDYHGGQLALDGSGKLMLSGDPGMKVGAMLPALSQIVGQPRIVPLYSSVSGTGQNAQFTITGFAACRVMDVDLHGGGKYLKVQPAAMITRGGIQGNGTNSSTHIYSPVVLVK